MKAKLNQKTQMWIVGAAALFFMLLIALIINWVRIGSLSSRAKGCEADIAAQSRQIEENKKAIDQLKDPDHKDYVALTEYGMVKDGEELWTAA